jgi:Transglutaminase-like superfamily/Coenzyme PQQ synthesis protein D (PqqD)
MTVTVHQPPNVATEGRHYRLAPDVVFIPLEGGTAQLIDLDGSFFSLSQTAALMLKATLDVGEAEAARQIATEYDVDPRAVCVDLRGLLRTLGERGLIQRGDDHPRRFGLRRAAASLVSYPAVMIAALISSPRLKALVLLAFARLSFALAGWARTMEAWQKHMVSPLDVSSTAHERQQLVDTIESAIRFSAHAWRAISCKERALGCWFMLRSAGVPARLVMGVRLSPFAAHCWCEVDERVLTDAPDDSQAYTPMICYDGQQAMPH